VLWWRHPVEVYLISCIEYGNKLHRVYTLFPVWDVGVLASSPLVFRIFKVIYPDTSTLHRLHTFTLGRSISFFSYSSALSNNFSVYDSLENSLPTPEDMPNRLVAPYQR
jgi:hypothetical protein